MTSGASGQLQADEGALGALGTAIRAWRHDAVGILLQADAQLRGVASAAPARASSRELRASPASRSVNPALSTVPAWPVARLLAARAEPPSGGSTGRRLRQACSAADVELMPARVEPSGAGRQHLVHGLAAVCALL